MGERERLGDEYRLVLPYGTAIDSDCIVTVDGVAYRVQRIVSQLSEAVDVQAMGVRDDT